VQGTCRQVVPGAGGASPSTAGWGDACPKPSSVSWRLLMACTSSCCKLCSWESSGCRTSAACMVCSELRCSSSCSWSSCINCDSAASSMHSCCTRAKLALGDQVSSVQESRLAHRRGRSGGIAASETLQDGPQDWDAGLSSLGCDTTIRVEPQFEFTQRPAAHLYTAYLHHIVKQSLEGSCCNQRIATSCRLLSASLSAYVSATRA
jgi:hypothetical protein